MFEAPRSKMRPVQARKQIQGEAPRHTERMATPIPPEEDNLGRIKTLQLPVSAGWPTPRATENAAGSALLRLPSRGFLPSAGPSRRALGHGTGTSATRNTLTNERGERRNPPAKVAGPPGRKTAGRLGDPVVFVARWISALCRILAHVRSACFFLSCWFSWRSFDGAFHD
jgi:hypothetical protein